MQLERILVVVFHVNSANTPSIVALFKLLGNLSRSEVKRTIFEYLWSLVDWNDARTSVFSTTISRAEVECAMVLDGTTHRRKKQKLSLLRLIVLSYTKRRTLSVINGYYTPTYTIHTLCYNNINNK